MQILCYACSVYKSHSGPARIALSISIFEPRHEKTCLRGFRPGQTQTRLYSHRRLLEAGIVLAMSQISCAADLRLCFRIYAKFRFSHDAAQLNE